MKLLQDNLIAIAIILSITLIGVIALTRNTDTKLDLKLGKDKSLTIEGNRLASPARSASLSLPEKTEIDCLPGKENSQLNCDS
jgi:hypothetical protein